MLDEMRDRLFHSPHRGIYILYGTPMSVCVKVMSKGVHNIAFYVTPDLGSLEYSEKSHKGLSYVYCITFYSVSYVLKM